MRNTSGTKQVDRKGAGIKPRWGLDSADAAYPGWRASRLPWALSYNPVGVPEGDALLKPGSRLHNKRLHADATAPSINLLAVASRLRCPSGADRGGARRETVACTLSYGSVSPWGRSKLVPLRGSPSLYSFEASVGTNVSPRAEGFVPSPEGDPG